MSAAIDSNKVSNDVIKKIPKTNKRVRILTGSHLEQLQSQCCDDCVLFYAKSEDKSYVKQRKGVQPCFGDVCRSPDSCFELEFDFSYADEDCIQEWENEPEPIDGIQTESLQLKPTIIEDGADMMIQVGSHPKSKFDKSSSSEKQPQNRSTPKSSIPPIMNEISSQNVTRSNTKLKNRNSPTAEVLKSQNFDSKTTNTPSVVMKSLNHTGSNFDSKTTNSPSVEMETLNHTGSNFDSKTTNSPSVEKETLNHTGSSFKPKITNSHSVEVSNKKNQRTKNENSSSLEIQSIESNSPRQVSRNSTIDRGYSKNVLEEISRCGKTIDDTILTPDSTIPEEEIFGPSKNRQIEKEKPAKTFKPIEKNQSPKTYNKDVYNSYTKHEKHSPQKPTAKLIDNFYSTKQETGFSNNVSPPIQKIEKRQELRLNNHLYDKEIPVLVSSMKQGYKEIAIRKKVLNNFSNANVNNELNLNHGSKNGKTTDNFSNKEFQDNSSNANGLQLSSHSESQDSYQKSPRSKIDNSANNSHANDNDWSFEEEDGSSDIPWIRSTKIKYPLLCDPHRLIILD
ncbi:uncharacterized membrane protein DDB_G0293934-like [Symsagittifera roscoffensis]|uniref:uncharacterized membrane protein DDB_G0293934-like n=1 Tax=Symsagittifera roscoffensis TaxID=84072 RepID=UPI00307B5BBD